MGARAESGSGVTPSMTLPAALDYARSHQPSLQAAQARIEVAKAAASAVRAEWLPQLGATAQLFYGTMNNSTAMFLGVRAVDLPRIGGSRGDGGFGDAYPSTVVALGLRQPIYDFGRLAALAAAADAETEGARSRALAEGLDVGLAVETLFYSVLSAHAVERAAEEAYRRSLVRRDMVKASVDRGLRPAIDLTRAEADLTRFAVGRTRAAGGVEQAQAMLAAVVGVPDLLLDAAPSEAARVDVDAAPAPLPPLGEAIAEALSRDPGLQVALARLAAQQAGTRATTLRLAPSLALSAGLSGRAGGAPTTGGPSPQSGWVPSVPNWDVGVVLQGPLFDGTVLAARRQSQAQEVVLRHEIDAVKRRLLSEIQRGYTAFMSAQAMLQALVSANAAAQRNYEQASARFRVGLSTSVELADAEMLRTDAEIQLSIGRFEVLRARAAFNRSLARGL